MSSSLIHIHTHTCAHHRYTYAEHIHAYKHTHNTHALTYTQYTYIMPGPHKNSLLIRTDIYTHTHTHAHTIDIHMQNTYMHTNIHTIHIHHDRAAQEQLAKLEGKSPEERKADILQRASCVYVYMYICIHIM
jgi:hypothetical protein